LLKLLFLAVSRVVIRIILNPFFRHIYG
jgi:hypothetical protein